MGSFQQISLGIICLVAAFAFGAYVNNNRISEQADVAKTDHSNDPVGNVKSRLQLDDADTVDKRPAPMATMRSPLPPPSQLAMPRRKSPASGMPIQKPSSVANPSAGVQVPDFSMIAAEFKNTPIELPPLVQPSDQSAMPERKQQVPIAKPGNVVSQVPLQNPAVEQPAESEAGSIGDRFRRATEAKSSMDDFANKLHGPTDSQSDEPKSLLKPPVNPDGSLAISNPDAPSQVQMPTFRASGSAAAESIAPDRQTIDTSGTYQVAEATDPDMGTSFTPPPAPAPERAKLPFGLTDESKNELARLRNTANNKIGLQSTRFIDHVVQQGESLQSISTKYFGKPDFYLDIYLANRNVLRNPAVVPTGITVRIPKYQ